METVTIGLAIPVPEPLGAQVRQVRAEVGDQAAATVPTHVTLVPPTQVLASDLNAILEHARGIAAKVAAFDLLLCGTGSFAPTTDVAYVCVTQGAQECTRLQEQLRQEPLVRELDYPYHPHVTLAQNVGEQACQRARQLIGEVHAQLRIASFTLYVQRLGQAWAPLETFSLGGL
ncbi:2'-5' RNA ligase family protein [Gephyromycinifex aptenodytis]|uniref:2'-5' RNA ligase family protein n=1 Tax=Gephyromycinifex aptenodytis TaxID=2716227 RepID=UPI0014450ACE|nr:2'-5' RNA ligase family protein [Gephyromycinifex aptenodytis]